MKASAPILDYINSKTMKTAPLFLASLLVGKILSAQTFTETATPFEGVDYSSVAIEDVNGDNAPDVLITGDSDNGRIAKLYLNNGNGVFAETPTPFEPVTASSVAIADVNGDNAPDVLITGEDTSFNAISKLYLNNGNGIFAETATPFEGVAYGSVAIADVNGDNAPDVLITGIPFNAISKLYLNNGNGVFAETATPFEGVAYGSVAIADVNGDNAPDVLITGGLTAKLYLNNGNGVFVETATPFEEVASGSVAIADVNGDNAPDVLITGNSASSDSEIAKLYLNNGNGVFVETATPFEGVLFGSVAIADVNGDNAPDVLITGFSTLDFLSHPSTPISKLYLNNGNGVFAETVTPFEEVGFSSVAIADVNGDNAPDVLITGIDTFPSNTPISKLYLNVGSITSIAQNSVSGPPFDFTISPNPTKTQLHISYKASENKPLIINIMDLQGRVVQTVEKNTGMGQQNFSIGLQTLAAGNYFIQLINGKKTGIKQLIIE